MVTFALTSPPKQDEWHARETGIDSQGFVHKSVPASRRGKQNGAGRKVAWSAEKKIQWNMVDAAVYMKGITSDTHFTNSSREISVGNDFIQDSGVLTTTSVCGTPIRSMCDATTMR